jgi:hypothetical protein
VSYAAPFPALPAAVTIRSVLMGDKPTLKKIPTALTASGKLTENPSSGRKKFR